MRTQSLTVELDEYDTAALKELATHEQLAVEDLVTVAVRDYIARRTMDDSEWKRRWDAVIASLQSGVPKDVTPEQIEADVSAARAEYRAERRARHG